MALSSDFTITGDTATYTLSEGSEKKAFTLNLAKLISNPAEALKALANGVRIRMREATGGKSFDDAASLLEDFAAAVNAGQYPARQREAGETRSSELIVTLAKVFHKGDTAAAQEEYDAILADEAASKHVDLDAEDKAGKDAIRKLKNEVRKTLTANPEVEAVLEEVKHEQQRAALDRQAERAKAARAKAAAANA